MSNPAPRLLWRDDFAIGVASIDHEHRELVGLINHIFERVNDTEAVADEFGEVYARISAHFALEEQLMRESRYD